jgi:hypothetical protein
MVGATSHAVAVEDARTLRLADGRLIRMAGLEAFALLSVNADQAEAAMRERLNALVAGKPCGFAFCQPSRTVTAACPHCWPTASGPVLQAALAAEGLAIAFATGEAFPASARSSRPKRKRRG